MALAPQTPNSPTPDEFHYEVLQIERVSSHERLMLIRTLLNVAEIIERLPGVTAATRGEAMPWLTQIYIDSLNPEGIVLLITQVLNDCEAVEKMLHNTDIDAMWEAPLKDDETA